MTEGKDYDYRAWELGLDIPDLSVTPFAGLSYGSMKSHHKVGKLLFLSGHIPEYPDRTLLYPGRLGAEVTVEQGYEAARLTALNCLGGIRYALGTLDKVRGIARSLNFVTCTPEFFEVNLVSNGATDLFRDVFGQEAGLGVRATVGVTSLNPNSCFECLLTVETDE